MKAKKVHWVISRPDKTCPYIADAVDMREAVMSAIHDRYMYSWGGLFHNVISGRNEKDFNYRISRFNSHRLMDLYKAYR